MFKKILVGLVVLVGAFAALVSAQPSTYRVERSATFAAPPEIAFALVNDFHGWELWSPWEKRDPNQKETYEGAPAGVGATYGWSGNDEVGEGRMTITESRANEHVAIKLEFIRPFESTNATSFSFAPEGEGVKVTWAMDGNNDFLGKAFSLFVDMDAMLGKDFESGLAAMKRAAEDKAKAAAEAKLEEEKKIAEQQAAQAEAEVAAPAEAVAQPTAP